MKPTKEEERRFWEQCGAKRDVSGCSFDRRWQKWVTPSGELFNEYPLIDLNNLFKYLPNRMSLALWRKIIREWATCLTGDYKEDVLALFWAIYKVLNEES